MWPRHLRGFDEVKVFLGSLSLVIFLSIAVLFAGIYFRSSQILIDTVKDQAESYYDLIVQTRLWNSQFGGVYVEKKGDVRSNPYLLDLGIDPDISCEGNRVLTLRNPSLMTREISRLTEMKSGVKFHITSLKPINPENAPDPFELNGLFLFEQGQREVWEIDRSAKPPVFRYMAPLLVDASCLTCHGGQGYKIGQVRGGISITIPLIHLDERIRTNRILIVIASLFIVVLLVGTLHFMVWKLVLRLSESRHQLRQMSTTDELTGLRNRRYIMERLGEEFHRARRIEKPMGLIMLDLDYFKQINDRYGHQFGDLVLKTVATRMRSSVREYDLVGRIGGEEFLILSPDSDIDETVRIAERIREIIKEEKIGDESKKVRVTISAGVTMLRDEDPNIDILFSRADNALYAAKQEGRDRVVVM